MTNFGKIAAITATLLATVVVMVTQPETVLLNAPVTEKSITPLIKKLSDDPVLDSFRSYRLVLNSPGGLVSQERLLVAMMKSSGREILTEVPVFAASAAASLFLQGKERVMHKNAVLVIHEVRILLSPSQVLTYSDAKSILEKGKLAPNSSLEGERLDQGGNIFEMLLGGKEPNKKESGKDSKTIVDDIKEMFGAELKDVVKSMEKDHLSDLHNIIEVTGLSKETVEKEILITNVDNEISADKALELGLATEIK